MIGIFPGLRLAVRFAVLNLNSLCETGPQATIEAFAHTIYASSILLAGILYAPSLIGAWGL